MVTARWKELLKQMEMHEKSSLDMNEHAKVQQHIVLEPRETGDDYLEL